MAESNRKKVRSHHVNSCRASRAANTVTARSMRANTTAVRQTLFDSASLLREGSMARTGSMAAPSDTFGLKRHGSVRSAFTLRSLCSSLVFDSRSVRWILQQEVCSPGDGNPPRSVCEPLFRTCHSGSGVVVSDLGWLKYEVIGIHPHP